MFELHASIQGMRSAEYYATIPLKFLIIMHNYQSTNQNHYPKIVMTSLDGINGRSIQTLLRGENESKQSDEIQATATDKATELDKKAL